MARSFRARSSRQLIWLSLTAWAAVGTGAAAGGSLRSGIADVGPAHPRADTLLDPKDLQEAGGKISEFMAGGDVLSQPQISAELSRLLRFLI